MVGTSSRAANANILPPTLNTRTSGPNGVLSVARALLRQYSRNCVRSIRPAGRVGFPEDLELQRVPVSSNRDRATSLFRAAPHLSLRAFQNQLSLRTGYQFHPDADTDVRWRRSHHRKRSCAAAKD